jgi:hypothetical protein
VFAVPTLYLGSAVALAMLVVAGEGESNVLAESQHAAKGIIFVIAAAFFVLSAILVLLRPHRGYTTALFSALAAISCLAWREFSNFYWGNSWIALNAPVVLSPVGERMRQAAVWLPILTAFLASVSFFLSALRLLPERWTVRGFPMRRRSWPAFALSGMILAVWFVCSVMPYRVPGNAHLGVHSRLRILHVEKRGLRLHETARWPYSRMGGSSSGVWIEGCLTIASQGTARTASCRRL